MGELLQMFKDRRQSPPVRTRREVAEHLSSAHGHEASPRMLHHDLHDTHDALHQMPSSHQHADQAPSNLGHGFFDE